MDPERRVSVNGTIIDKPKEKVLGGERVAIDAEIEEEQRWEAQNIPLDIVYEDDHIPVINKPRDLVVHPAPVIRRHGTECAAFITIRRLPTCRAPASCTVWIKTLPD